MSLLVASLKMDLCLHLDRHECSLRLRQCPSGFLRKSSDLNSDPSSALEMPHVRKDGLKVH